jgi:hypothetical protein
MAVACPRCGQPADRAASSTCLYCGQPLATEISLASTQDARPVDPRAGEAPLTVSSVADRRGVVAARDTILTASAPSPQQDIPPASAQRLTAPPALRARRRRQGVVRRISVGCGAAVLTFVLVILARVALDVAAGGLGGAAPGRADPTPNTSRVYAASLMAPGAGTSGWNNDSRCSAKHDGYHIVGSYICYAPIADAGNADISVQVRQILGDPFEPYGIAFRILGADSHYEFDIDSHGKWAMYKFADGTATTLVPFTANAAIARGLGVTNTLRVRARGSRFACFVNGVEVGQVDDTTFTSGKTGLVGDDGIEVVFTNFALTRL